MSTKPYIRIVKVPRELIAAMWPYCVVHLEKGLEAATTSTLDSIARDLADGADELWAVFQGRDLVASFLTALWKDEDEARDFLGVYGLGGAGLPDWAHAIDEAMQAEAKALGCASIRFCGRQAWSRVLPALTVRGSAGDHAVFERSLS